MKNGDYTDEFNKFKAGQKGKNTNIWGLGDVRDAFFAGIKIGLLADRSDAEDAPEKCEGGCSGPVVAHDSEGVPLCQKCRDMLVEEAMAETKGKQS